MALFDFKAMIFKLGAFESKFEVKWLSFVKVFISCWILKIVVNSFYFAHYLHLKGKKCLKENRPEAIDYF